MSDTVIRVGNLGKQYRFGLIDHGTLHKDLQSWWARMRGKEDPNAIVTNHAGPGLSGERFWALKDISFEVEKGQVLGIIGRNGAGKSTLLKILSQVTTPTEGSVKIKGRVASLLEVGTGFHPELTGRENVYLNGMILGMTKAEIDKKYDEIVDFSGVQKFIDTPVKRYSSGMRVRLAFAVAAHLDPEILIVDEVLAVGDVDFQDKCLGKMRDVTNSGRTILFVSHNMQAIKQLCDRGIVLDSGQIAYSGTAGDAVDKYLKSRMTHSINSDIPAEMHKTPKPDIEVHRVEIQDTSGQLLNALKMQQRFQLKLYYTVNRDSTCRMSVAFRNEQGVLICDTVNNDLQRCWISGCVGQRYVLTIEIHNIFVAGKYVLEVHLKNKTKRKVDAIEGISFEVLPVSVSGGTIRGYGVVQLDSQWGAPVLYKGDDSA